MNLIIPGEPVAWQRAGRSKKGHFYTKEETRTFERRIRGLVAVELMRSRIEKPYAGPVLLHVKAFFSALKETVLGKGPRELKPTRPDVDNISKGILDACNGTVLTDDGQVSILVAEKWHAAGDEDARTEVALKPIDVLLAHKCPLCGRGKPE